MPTFTPETSRVRLGAKATTIDELVLEFANTPPPPLPAGHALVRVRHAAVNPSDVKAALGLMPQAVWPRTPGRDYAGVVVDGPAAWIGREVWGSGGDVGITRDGSHGSWLILPEAALREKPRALPFEAAGSVGVPFVTAYEGFRRSGMPRAGQTVVVMGANGKVGQAAVQLAAQAGARVFAVQRGAEFAGYAHSAPQVVDARESQIAEAVLDQTGGRGADIVFNTVGSPYFEAANRLMTKGATQILISTLQRPVDFDIFTFYRGMHTYVGIDTLALGCIDSNERLAAMAPGFEAGTLRPFEVRPDDIYPLAQALAAYRRVLGGDDQRIVLCPDT